MCGPPMMNAAVISMLLDLGVDRENICWMTSAVDPGNRHEIEDAAGGVVVARHLVVARKCPHSGRAQLSHHRVVMRAGRAAADKHVVQTMRQKQLPAPGSES